MAKVIVMPKLGLTMTEGTVSKWLKTRAMKSKRAKASLKLRQISLPIR